MLIFALIIGGIVYFLCGKKEEDDGSDTVFVKEMRQKKEKLKDACSQMKDQSKNIADEVKFAAGYTAQEMKDSWKNSGEAVKTAAENIREDVREMKESAESVFESEEQA